MKSIIDRYLDLVLLYANKPESEAQDIRHELEDHLWQKVDDLAETGLPREEAILKALRQHGPPRIIGYRLRGRFPWVDIRTRGDARGVIAIGPRAHGIFAAGVYAVGLFAVGVFGFGIFALGVIPFGLFFGIGGFYPLGVRFHWGIFPMDKFIIYTFIGTANAISSILGNPEGKADWLIEG